MFKKIMFIGLGNHKHIRIRSSVGIQVVNYVAELNNLTWHKNNNISGEFARLNIYVDPKPPSRLTLNKSDSRRSVNKEKDYLKQKPDQKLNEIRSFFSDRKKLISSSTRSISTRLIDNNNKNSSILDTINYIPIEIVLFKPSLLMHISGEAVAKAVNHFEMSPSNIIVIHDDIEREIGKISLKLGGSSSGHIGLKSVIGCLETEKFCRLRVGIDRPKTHFDRDTVDSPKTYYDRDTSYRPNTYNDRDTAYKPKKYYDKDAKLLQKYMVGTPMHEESNYFNKEVFPKCHDALIECCIDDDILQKNIL